MPIGTIATRPRWKALWLLVVLALVFSAVIAGTADAKQPDKGDDVAFWLTVLHNNDGESELVNLGTGLEDFGGAARFKTLVDDLKWSATHATPSQPGAKRGVIMVSSGDNFLAGPEFNAGLANGIPFYDTIAMDLIGYDAVDIGNHDFDFGPDVLADFISGYQYTQPPYLSANLDFANEPRMQAFVDAGRVAKSVVVKERGEYIGIIGATTPNITFISSPRDVIVSEVAPAVEAEVEKLEAMGIEMIVLISHLQDVEGDIALAAELDGIDVMVAGGGDELLANPGDLLVPGDEGSVFGPYPMTAVDIDGTEVPVVTTAGQYGYVGQLVVGFNKAGDVVAIDEGLSGPKRVVGGECNETLPCDDAVMPDPMVQALAVDPVEEALDALATSVLATSDVDLDGRRSSVRGGESNEGNLIADALLWKAEMLAADFGVAMPDVALQNGGGIRNDAILPAGDITELDAWSMVPFPNFVSVLEDIPRSQFKEILENAVSRTQSGDTPGGTGRFAQIAGFTFEWSASGTAQVLNPDGTVATIGTRVQEVTLDDATPIVSGGAVVAGSDLTIATIDFLARGGDEYPYRGAPFVSLGATYQQALADYMVDALGGVVSGTDYPFGGEGRITELP
ncbi:MAG: 5'-nucleotidase C-terminal domain-containing protein [Actinomycetota bacterium]|nr:5'-nucleotidase C-terminal domain-containing protein [Actinomycetota bacterium]